MRHVAMQVAAFLAFVGAPHIRRLVEVSMVQRGDSVPHFEVTSLEGEPFRYSTIWQRKNLLLVALPTADSEWASAYTTDVTPRAREFRDQDLECVITRDHVPGIAPPAVLIADRWGEVVFVAESSEIANLPAPEELMEWVRYMTYRCPECEGETR